ncbi:MAG: tetratricopeptide repeat protein, partial [Oscillospiraceae bacterium]|nr:tetratricopeptide repeat protein [Oscillospiraceae bacterium]
MKKIKLFLASSIEDLNFDRIAMGDFVRQLNDIYIDRDIYFSLIRCESYDQAMAEGGKQAQYDEEIRESELVFFLFFKKVGDYTRHEFEVALESWRNSSSPKIVTYIKYVDNISEVNAEVKAFMDMLDGEMRHYYNTYKSIDTLKLGMLMQIKLMKLDSSVIDVQKSKICVNGQEIADCGKIPMFEGNTSIWRLNEELKGITKEYYALREKYVKDPNDMDIYIKYSDIAKKKADTEEKIRELEKQTLNLAEKMTEDMSSGNLSDKQKEGYRLLEAGDYKGALEVLNLEEILRDISHNELLSDGITERLQTNVNELLQRIEALRADGMSYETAEEINEIYKKACALAEKHNLDKGALYDYAKFLYTQKDYLAAINAAERLQYYYSNPNEPASEEKWAYLYNLLGNLYGDTQSYKEAEVLHKKAIEIQERLCKQNPDTFEPVLAKSYNNLGVLYDDIQGYEDSETFYKKAIEIYAKLSKKNPDAFEPDLA